MKKRFDTWLKITGACAVILVILSVVYGSFLLIGFGVVSMIAAYILYKSGNKSRTGKHES